MAFTPRPPSESPNLMGGALRPGALDQYYRAMVVAYASVRAYNPDVSLVFASPEGPPDAFRESFSRLGVEHIEVAFRHEPPLGFGPNYAASLFMLDVLESLSTIPTPLIFLDPDVICLAPLAPMVAAAGSSIGAYPIDFPSDFVINGLSRGSARALHNALGRESDVQPPVHYGGECFVFPPDTITAILPAVDQAWSASLSWAAAGEHRFTTEEHILSFALSDADVVDLSSFVARVSTAPRYRNIPAGWRNLSVWHLPAEKGLAFDLLFRWITDDPTWLAEQVAAGTFPAKVGKAAGIPRRGARRTLRDVSRSSLRRILPAAGERAPDWKGPASVSRE